MNYGDPSYWQQRYKESPSQTFDWLQDYSSLKYLFQKYYPSKDKKILNLGCGNSNLTQKMFDQGYKNIYNIDISKQVINQMKNRNSLKRPSLIFQVLIITKVMDVKSLKYQDNYFDIVLDKSTIDALLCGDNPSQNVFQMLSQTKRVLKQGGKYFGISYGQPKSRIFHYKKLNFEVYYCNLGLKYDNGKLFII